MENLIVAIILLAVIGAVVFYLVKEKKKGRQCVGCPYSKQCAEHCLGGTSCCGGTSEKINTK